MQIPHYLLILLLLAPHTALTSQVRRPDVPQPADAAVVEGAVRETSSGTPLSDVTVVIQDQAGNRLGAISGKDGRFRIDGVAEGTFQLDASRGEFVSATMRDLRLRRGEQRTVVVEITLPVPTPTSDGIQRPGATTPQINVPAINEIASAAGFARPSRETSIGPAIVESTVPDFVRVNDRWRAPMPVWQRYLDDGSRETPYSVTGRWWDPYHQNVLKGDYPVLGNRWFTSFTASSETTIDSRRVRVADPSQKPGADTRFSENLIVSGEIFRGVAAFRPVDLRLRVTPVFNANRLTTRLPATRWDSQAAALQEAFAEVRVAELSPSFDFLSVRAGTQFFKSDFRGFIFSDNEPGVRLFGNLKSNRHQYNVAYFRMLAKDPNTFLNTLDSRNQNVFIANYYLQDFLKPGYTTEFSIHADRERGPKRIDATYLGWTGDGHLGRFNVDHAFYQVIGNERSVSGAESRINAQMAAAEISIDHDWRRYRASFFYASGDGDPLDHRSRGFDSIFDNVQFAGGPISFWNRQEVRLAAAGVTLTNRASLISSLRGSKERGQANFTNPGLYIVNAGLDSDITPRLRASANLNFLSFVRTETLEAVLARSGVPRTIGFDLGSGVRWRPLLSENVIVAAGGAVLLPMHGFRQAFNSGALFSTFIELRLTY